MQRSGEKYALPRHWFGFGIHIRDEFQKRRNKIESWHVAYHGTSRQNVESVLRERQIMFPGDIFQDGTMLPVAHGACGAHLLAKDGGAPPPVVYVSPTIHDASMPCYATPFEFEGRRVQAVLQCRVKPGACAKYGKTIPPSHAGHLDPEVQELTPPNSWDSEFNDDQLEWIVADREGVVPYRLLLRWY